MVIDSTPETIVIPLSHGQETIVSTEDDDLVSLKWYALFDSKYSGGGKFLAKRHVRNTAGKYTTEYLHRVVLSRMLGRPLLRSEQVDHINGNTLDNCRENLRLANISQNNMNKTKTSRNSSGFKGVSWNQKLGRWVATVCINYKLRYLGLFDTPEEAHEAYCKAARELHREFFNPG